MRLLYLIGCLLLGVKLTAQDTPGKQLQIIVEDSRRFFERTKGSETLDLDSTPIYKSKITLADTKDNTIQIAKDGKTWAFYHAYVSDSTSLKGAKKLAEYWRSLVESNVEGFIEDKTKRTTKSIMAKPLHGYVFAKKEGTTEYSISIIYSKSLSGTYIIFLQIGRQY